MRTRWAALDERIADLDAEFADAARTDERMRRLLTIPGIGALNATALVAAVGDARTRAWPRPGGMVGPRAASGDHRGQTSTAWHHQARQPVSPQEPDPGCSFVTADDEQERHTAGAWLRGLLSRSHPNTVVVALAAKMARIVWALLRHERTYEIAARAA